MPEGVLDMTPMGRFLAYLGLWAELRGHFLSVNEAMSSSSASEEKASVLVLYICHVALLLGGAHA